MTDKDSGAVVIIDAGEQSEALRYIAEQSQRAVADTGAVILGHVVPDEPRHNSYMQAVVHAHLMHQCAVEDWHRYDSLHQHPSDLGRLTPVPQAELYLLPESAILITREGGAVDCIRSGPAKWCSVVGKRRERFCQMGTPGYAGELGTGVRVKARRVTCLHCLYLMGPWPVTTVSLPWIFQAARMPAKTRDAWNALIDIAEGLRPGQDLEREGLQKKLHKLKRELRARRRRQQAQRRR